MNEWAQQCGTYLTEHVMCRDRAVFVNEFVFLSSSPQRQCVIFPPRRGQIRRALLAAWDDDGEG